MRELWNSARAGLAVAALLLAGPLDAAEPWLGEPFAAAPADVLAAAAEVTAPAGADVVVLYRDTSYQFDESSRVTYRQRLVYLLRNAAGVEGWSETEVAWAPWYQERPVLRTRVLVPGGGELWLDPETAREGPAPGGDADASSDRLLLTAPLPGLVPGAVVEEEVVVRDRESFFAAGVSGVHLLRMLAPVSRSRFVLDAPVGLPLRYATSLAPGLEPRREIAAGRVRVVFEPGPTPPLERPEPGLPSWVARFPQVSFSTGESWRAVAGSYARLVDEQASAAALSLPRATAATPRGRVDELVAAARRAVRYTGLELGDSSIVPAPPELTLERGFGDCKDQATLLVALLEREGIAASVALVNAGSGEDVDPRLPGFGRFNHALVYVSGEGTGGAPLWIDPTEPAARPGELPAEVQGRWALLADAATEKLRRTPTANSVDNLTRETREVFLADHGPARVVETSVFSGEPERQQRRLLRSSSDDVRREGYREYVEGTYLAAELGMVEESDPEDLDVPFTLKLEAVDAERAVTDLQAAVVAIRREGLTASLPSALIEAGGPRREPFVVDQPYVVEWRYRIVPPAGFGPRELPADVLRELGEARYSHTFREEEGEVRATLRFDSGPRYLEPEKLATTRRALRSFLSEEPLVIWFDHRGAALLAAGRRAEGFAELRRLAELEPERAIHRVRLSQALLEAGLGGAARSAARAAVELDPGSWLAHWALGFALEHDELGRRFAPGSDGRGAREALEKAVELAPEASLPRNELAILLEYDEDGRRYSAGADLDGAIAQYRILRGELGAKSLDMNLISALYWAGRWSELYAATLPLVASPSSDETHKTARYLHLMAVAALDGAEAAVRASENLSGGPQERITLLNQAAQHLVNARLYPQAAALLRWVARFAANPEPILERVRALSRARRYEDLEIDATDPAGLARRFLLTLDTRRFDGAHLEELFHPQYLADHRRGEDGDAALRGFFETLRRERLQRAGGLSEAALIDLALAVTQVAVDGEAARGFRVRMINSLDDTLALTVYVTTHEGRPVIAAIQGEDGQIGKEVLRRLAADDLRGAHQWLDWARDAATPRESEDPYDIRAFARFWIRGTGAFRDRMRLGAALLMSDQPEAGEAVAILEEALASGAGGAPVEVVERALVDAYRVLSRAGDLTALAERMVKRHPSSSVAFTAWSEALIKARRWDELGRVAEERRASHPDDPEAIRYLARWAFHEGDTDRGRSLTAELEEAGEATTPDLSLAAWMLVLEEGDLPEAERLARRAVELSPSGDAEALLTLAVVAAERSRPVDARQALVESLAVRAEPRPEDGDWWVLGRIAEEYGFGEHARELYAKVSADSSFAKLVERRQREWRSR